LLRESNERSRNLGIFQRYKKRDKHGNPVLGRNGKPRREGPWFIQYPHTRDPQTGKIAYRTEKASFSKKRAEKIFRAKVDAFEESDKLGRQADLEIAFSELIDWGLNQDVMKVKVSSSDDANNAKHLKSGFGNIKAAQVTPLMVENFRIKMRRTPSDKTKESYSGATVNKMVSLARRIYYLAMDADKVTHNPFARRGTFKEEPKGQYIPDQEFQKICDFLVDYLKPVAVTGFLTGMRRGEVLGLKWDRVDLIGGFIDLTSDETKTSEPRRIFFNSLEELKKIFVEAAKNRSRGSDLVFTKPDGNPVPKWYMERLFKKACEKAGVGPYRFHDLRHTFNTNMLKAGVDQVVIMKLTGHKTNAMFNRYSHLDQEIGERAMGKLEQLLAGVRGRAAHESGQAQNERAERGKEIELPFCSA
jgi:integrase